jgi:hypothetical protein
MPSCEKSRYEHIDNGGFAEKNRLYIFPDFAGEFGDGL